METPLRILTPARYAEITDKALTSDKPTALYFVPEEGKVYILPTPAIADLEVALYVPVTDVSFATLTTELSLAPGYLRALVYNLAVDWAPELGVEHVPDRIQRVALDSLAAIKRANEDVPEIATDPALRWGEGHYDIENDE
jgi:hypothetical protein